MAEPTAIVDPRQSDAVKAMGGPLADIMRAATSAAVELVNEGGLEWAAAVLGEIKKHRERIEELRRQFVHPLNEHIRFVNRVFKDMDTGLATADQDLRRRVLAYRQAIETARRQQELEATAAAEKARATIIAAEPQTTLEDLAALHVAEEQVAAVPAPVPTTVRTSLGSATVRRRWTFEVVDAAAIPREYLVLDAVRVREEVRLGARAIVGLRIFQEESLVVGEGSA